MKKIIMVFSLLAFFFSSTAQPCEEREEKLLQAVGSFSAATFYNTYAVLGSIGDGYAHEVYNAAMVKELMDAQENLSDNLIRVFQQLIEKKIFIARVDIDYAVEAIDILTGLKTQAQLMKEYSSSRKKQKLTDYEDQRNKNWSAISKLMGIKEE